MKGRLPAAIAIATGLITLIGLLLPVDLLGLRLIADVFLQLVIFIAAVALLLGVINLLYVHLGRLIRFQKGWFYSLVLVASFIGVLTVGIIDRAQGTDWSGKVFEVVQVSLESAFSGMLAFILIYAAIRMLRRRVTLSGLLFMIVVIVVLLGWSGHPRLGPVSALSDWIQAVPAVAGARGLLIGIALGTVTVGVRALLGQDRSYRN